MDTRAANAIKDVVRLCSSSPVSRKRQLRPFSRDTETSCPVGGLGTCLPKVGSYLVGRKAGNVS